MNQGAWSILACGTARANPIHHFFGRPELIKINNFLNPSSRLFEHDVSQSSRDDLEVKVIGG